MIIRKAFKKCPHKWKTINAACISSNLFGDKILLLLACEKCGKIKKIKI